MSCPVEELTDVLRKERDDVVQKIQALQLSFKNLSVLLGPKTKEDIMAFLKMASEKPSNRVQISRGKALLSTLEHQWQEKLEEARCLTLKNGERLMLDMAPTHVQKICEAIWKEGLLNKVEYQKLCHVLPFHHAARQLADDLSRADILYQPRTEGYSKACYRKSFPIRDDLSGMIQHNQLAARRLFTSAQHSGALTSYQDFLASYDSYDHRPVLRDKDRPTDQYKLDPKTFRVIGPGELETRSVRRGRKRSRQATKKYSMSIIPKNLKLTLFGESEDYLLGVLFDTNQLKIKGRFCHNPVTFLRGWVDDSEAKVKAYAEQKMFREAQHEAYLQLVNEDSTWKEIHAKFTRESITGLFIADNPKSRQLARETLLKLKTDYPVFFWDNGAGEMRVYTKQEQLDDELGFNLLKELTFEALSTKDLEVFFNSLLVLKDEWEPFCQTFCNILNTMYIKQDTREKVVQFIAEKLTSPSDDAIFFKTLRNPFYRELVISSLVRASSRYSDAVKLNFILKNKHIDFEIKYHFLREMRKPPPLDAQVKESMFAKWKRQLEETKYALGEVFEVSWDSSEASFLAAQMPAEATAIQAQLNALRGSRLKLYILQKISELIEKLATPDAIDTFELRFEESAEYRVIASGEPPIELELFQAEVDSKRRGFAASI